MEITPRQGEGLRVPMDFYLRLRRDTDGADFWGSDCQEYLTEKLAPFLPRMEYDPMDNTVTASLFQGADGKSREEMLCRSEGLDRLSGIPKKTYKALKKKVDELLREVDAEGADPEMKSMVEAFALPDPQKSPELYRVYGKGKLAILWGLERNADESIPLREIVRRDDCHSPGQWKKWLCVLLLVVAFGVGAFLYHCIACGGGGRDAPSGQITVKSNKGGNGTHSGGSGESNGAGGQISTPDTDEQGPQGEDGTPVTRGGNSRGSGDTPAPREGGSGPSGSTVSGPVDQPVTQTAPANSGNGDKEPTVPVQEKGTSPQPGGGNGTATETEGKPGTTPDGTAGQGVRVTPQGVPTEPSNGDKKNTGKDRGGTQSPTVDSTSAPRTAEGTEETQNSSGGGDKTPTVDTVSDTPTVPVLTEGTSPQPEDGDSADTGAEGNSAISAEDTAEQGVRVDPMQKGIQVEFPGRVIDFRFDVLPRKDVAPGNVRVSVQVSVIEGADNAIESGWIKGEPLDANHCAEVQIKGREEELPYEIKLRNSKYPVTGGCKITIGTTK